MPIVKAPDTSDSGSDMDSLYSEEDAGSSSSSDAAETEGKPEVEGHTELVSKKLLAGKDVKPGDEVILTVVKDYGDEVELKYATKKKAPSMSEDEELDALSA